MNLDAQSARLSENLGRNDTLGEIGFVFSEQDDGPLLGSISFIRQRVLNPRAVELGYWIRTSAAGRGLTTLATRCLCVVALDYLGCTRIQCIYDEANIGSQRVCEKAGFQPEARLRNFGVPATEETRGQGDISTNFFKMTALFPEDRPNLSWYTQIQEHLQVFDANSQLAKPGFIL